MPRQKIAIAPLDVESASQNNVVTRLTENFIPIATPNGMALEAAPSSTILHGAATGARRGFYVYRGSVAIWHLHLTETHLTVTEPDGTNETTLLALPATAEGAHFAQLGIDVFVVIHYTDGVARDPVVVRERGRVTDGAAMPRVLTWGWPELPRMGLDIQELTVPGDGQFRAGRAGIRYAYLMTDGTTGPASRVYTGQSLRWGFTVKLTAKDIPDLSGHPGITGIAMLVSEDLNDRSEAEQLEDGKFVDGIRLPSVDDLTSSAYFHVASIEDLAGPAEVEYGGTAEQIVSNPSYEEGLLGPRKVLPQAATVLNGRLVMGDLTYEYPAPSLVHSWDDGLGSGFGAIGNPVIVGASVVWDSLLGPDGYLYTATAPTGQTCSLLFDNLPPGATTVREYSDDNAVWLPGYVESEFMRARVFVVPDEQHWNNTFLFSAQSTTPAGGSAESEFTFSFGEEVIAPSIAPQINGWDIDVALADVAPYPPMYYTIVNTIDAPAILDVLQFPSFGSWVIEYSANGVTGWTETYIENTSHSRVKFDWTTPISAADIGTYVMEIRATNFAGEGSASSGGSFLVTVLEVAPNVIVTGPVSGLGSPISWNLEDYGEAHVGTEGGVRIDLIESEGNDITIITTEDLYVAGPDPPNPFPVGSKQQIEYWEVATQSWLPDILPTDRARVRWSPGPDDAGNIYKLRVTGTNGIQPSPTTFDVYIEMDEITGFMIMTTGERVDIEQGRNLLRGEDSNNE